MTDNVIVFTGETTLDIDPDRILQAAIGKLERVTIIGADKDGNEYHATSSGNITVRTWDVSRYWYAQMKRFDEE